MLFHGATFIDTIRDAFYGGNELKRYPGLDLLTLTRILSGHRYTEILPCELNKDICSRVADSYGVNSITKKIKYVNLNNLSLFDGSDFFGNHIDDITIAGFSSALLHIRNGVKRLSLIGHSRGAVTAIYITHMINILKDSLNQIDLKFNNNIYIYKIIFAKIAGIFVTSKIKRDMLYDIASSIGLSNLYILRQQLNQLSVTLDLIDPVHGEEVQFIIKKMSYAHFQKRHYISPIVEDVKLYKSNMDLPIFSVLDIKPIAIENTQIKVYHLGSSHVGIIGCGFGKSIFEARAIKNFLLANCLTRCLEANIIIDPGFLDFEELYIFTKSEWKNYYYEIKELVKEVLFHFGRGTINQYIDKLYYYGISKELKQAYFKPGSAANRVHRFLQRLF